MLLDDFGSVREGQNPRTMQRWPEQLAIAHMAPSFD
jgi:hypothetical protein